MRRARSLASTALSLTLPNGRSSRNSSCARNASKTSEAWGGIAHDLNNVLSPIVMGVFDPFFTTKEIGTGTGFGLSTVNAIVKSHGGIVTVESSVKHGTAFRVYLPALANDVPQEEYGTASTFPAGEGELILVVDDEAAVRDLARTILENYGYRALVATDGAEGVTIYSQNEGQIDLVVTDLDMPKNERC